jgi:hypothetical protein
LLLDAARSGRWCQSSQFRPRATNPALHRPQVRPPATMFYFSLRAEDFAVWWPDRRQRFGVRLPLARFAIFCGAAFCERVTGVRPVSPSSAPWSVLAAPFEEQRTSERIGGMRCPHRLRIGDRCHDAPAFRSQFVEPRQRPLTSPSVGFRQEDPVLERRCHPKRSIDQLPGQDRVDGGRPSWDSGGSSNSGVLGIYSVLRSSLTFPGLPAASYTASSCSASAASTLGNR